MPNDVKRVEELSPEDLAQSPVWEFLNDDVQEFLVRPVPSPVSDMSCRLVATFVTLASGARFQALLGNIDVDSVQSTQHFLTLSIEREGRWFHLARYHDVDRDRAGPVALARFLELSPAEVFPISYNVSTHVVGDVSVTSGTILAEPVERLTSSELIALAVK